MPKQPTTEPAVEPTTKATSQTDYNSNLMAVAFELLRLHFAFLQYAIQVKGNSDVLRDHLWLNNTGYILGCMVRLANSVTTMRPPSHHNETHTDAIQAAALYRRGALTVAAGIQRLDSFAVKDGGELLAAAVPMIGRILITLKKEQIDG